MTLGGVSGASSSSGATEAGLILARATDSTPLPGMETLKKVGCLSITLYGPV